MKRVVFLACVVLMAACQPVQEPVAAPPAQEHHVQAPVGEPEMPVVAEPEETPPKEAEPAEPATRYLVIDIYRKRFEPPVTTADLGTVLVLTNRDTIVHPIFIRHEGVLFLKSTLIDPEGELVIPLKKPGVYKLFEPTYGTKGQIDVQKSTVIIPGKITS